MDRCGVSVTVDGLSLSPAVSINAAPSRFESLILSHHSKFEVTSECYKEEINDDEDDDDASPPPYPSQQSSYYEKGDEALDKLLRSGQDLA